MDNSNDHLNEVSVFFHLNVERAGGILSVNDGMINSKILLNSDREKDSMKINLEKNHMFSITHSAAAYINAEYVYGHPLGDIKEFVKLVH